MGHKCHGSGRSKRYRVNETVYKMISGRRGGLQEGINCRIRFGSGQLEKYFSRSDQRHTPG